MPAPRICGRIPGVGRGCRRWAVGGGRAGGWALKSGARYASTKVVLSSVPSRLTSPASSETSGGEVEHPRESEGGGGRRRRGWRSGREGLWHVLGVKARRLLKFKSITQGTPRRPLAIPPPSSLAE